MFHQLVSHNPDLARLLEKGYALGFDSGYLIVRDIPYLDAAGALKTGAIVSKYTSVDGDRIAPDDHQILFAGSMPHNVDGTPVRNLGGGGHTLHLPNSPDVVVERSFSNKKIENGTMVPYVDFFEKIENYVAQIAGPAIERFGANPLTFRAVHHVADSVFCFDDTLTSRAEITDLAGRLKEDVIAIIGLGGTGAYILDFMVRTPVKEIRGFDADVYHVHNGYRSPGRLRKAEFDKPKARVYELRYKNFRKGLHFRTKFIDASSAADLEGVTFAFVCVDKGTSRAGIMDLLGQMNIPFIDVGMGLFRTGEPIDGMVRTTYFPPDRASQIRDENLVATADDPDDIYKTNIQIGELNALNAAIAVLRFKQIRGFYFDESPDVYHSIFSLGNAKIQHHPQA